MTRIRDLVKTYKLLNDPDAPRWNVKFLGACTGVVAVAALVVAAALWAPSPAAPAGTPGTVASTGASDPAAGGGAGAGAGTGDGGGGGAGTEPATAGLNATLPSPTLGLP